MANGLSRSPTRLWVACKPSTVLADTAFGSVTSCCNVLNSSVLSGLPSFHRSGQTARSFGPDWLPTAPVRLAVAIADSTAEAVGFAVAAAIASCSSFSSEEVEPLAAALWLLALALPPVAGSPELWAVTSPSYTSKTPLVQQAGGTGECVASSPPWRSSICRRESPGSDGGYYP